MDNEWTETQEQKIERGGKIVGRKIILEKRKFNKKFLGVEFETIDILIRLFGITLIVIAVFDYINKVEDRNNENIRQNTAETEATKRYRDEQTRQAKEDSQRQINFQRELEEKRRILEKTFANSLQQIAAQKQLDIDKEKREYYSTTLTKISTKMAILLQKPPYSQSYIDAKEELTTELYGKLIPIRDKNISEVFAQFKRLLEITELVKEIGFACDSMDSHVDNITFRLYGIKYSYEEDTMNYKRVALQKDSSLFNYNRWRIGIGLSALTSKSKEAKYLSESFKDDYSNMLDKISILSGDTLYEGYLGQMQLAAFLFQNLTESRSYTIELEKLCRNYVERFLEWPEIMHLNENKQLMTDTEEYFNRLIIETKSRFDSLMEKRIEFYSVK
ncbi:MAG: hypothetical protein JWO09_3419 [Bacteroidetes bacterium]|nr:hypothetical protein [Bacteroidota bacterium]